MCLKDEIHWFVENQEFLKQRYAGMHVAVKDQKVRIAAKSCHKVYHRAFKAGLEGPFLIRDVDFKPSINVIMIS